ncbi:MAG: YdcF family protein [Acetobacter sp.]|nr:YdcF family protein [Acetobacter sp.]
MASSPSVIVGKKRKWGYTLISVFISVILLPFFILLCGFGWFLYDALHPHPASSLHADGIVAFTGGAGRVETALSLLAHHHGNYLLISGVAPKTPIKSLFPVSVPPDIRPRITLGYKAHSTIENAQETADWVHTIHAHSLIIVTAGYHMQRAVLELSRVLPTITLYPYPVTPPALRHPFCSTSIKLLTTEYLKWLGALMGFTHKP